MFDRCAIAGLVAVVVAYVSYITMRPDRWTSRDQAAFMSEEFYPLERRVKALEARVTGLEHRAVVGSP